MAPNNSRKPRFFKPLIAPPPAAVPPINDASTEGSPPDDPATDETKALLPEKKKVGFKSTTSEDVAGDPPKQDDKPPPKGKIKSTRSFLALSKAKKPRATYAKNARKNAQAGPSSISKILQEAGRGAQQPPETPGTGRPSAVRIQTKADKTPVVKEPQTTARPMKSILKKVSRQGGEQGRSPPELQRPEIVLQETSYLYQPMVVPRMQSQRAISTVSIPKYTHTKPRVGILLPTFRRGSYAHKKKKAPKIVRRQQQWARKVFLSDCGQFVIIHEFPMFDQNSGETSLGDRVMRRTTSQESKIVIYRSFGKLAVINEDVPQPEYGRSRRPVSIPGMPQSDDLEDNGTNPPYILTKKPKQTQWATDPQIVAEWSFPRDQIITHTKVSMDIGKGVDGNV